MSGKRYKIMIEASGSLAVGYLISNIQAAGHECIASDIDEESVGKLLADNFILMPLAGDPGLWQHAHDALTEMSIDIVIPSLDETLQGWAQRKQSYAQRGISVIVSDPDVVAICQDKWRTFQFFAEHGIPTAETSLTQDYPLVKPRTGRGGAGVQVTHKKVDMDGMISQEILSGTEYTIDIFCSAESQPEYIVPRRRINVRDGKSTAGVVEKHSGIEAWVRAICKRLRFIGPVNMQCFVLPDGSIKFVEINPRIAGGMALGFAATENWINLIVDNIIEGKPIVPRPIQDGLKMRRYYSEVFATSD
ncbi:carbamoyl-phosphate synthase large subunit [Marinobacter persicus]|uniref:Carbamoyl-phosphate synthase large subunit n=1 Tax=Marinobacter persicus TaxID=930118 RepID=A0A1I3PAE3_9GAMM|nr:ATP-grasp domain-containing protein [Marinobacter persicus]SFJ18554.1 carbamoyl-phosphate synthase large subunit [Marinobacter persicus]